MIPERGPGVILLADDDPEDRMLAEEALVGNPFAKDVRTVVDGEELLDYLYRRGRFNAENAPRPGLILLDLNMPKIDGREALAVIKADRFLRDIPIVVMTTSTAEEDIERSYFLGANSFVTKPASLESLNFFTQSICEYWMGLVALPPPERPLRTEN